MFPQSLRVWLLVAFVIAAWASDLLADAKTQRPNIVLILADDLGWSDLACYGSDLHETPHVDGLAKQGVRFTNAYAASPVCSPTRASILTGKHPARLHMTIWREAAEQRGRRKVLEPITRGDLPLEEVTLAEVLSSAGYYTAHVGKWHLGTAPYYPQPHGFAVNVGGTLWGAPQTFFYPFRGEQYFRDWRYVPDLEPGEEGEYLTDRLTDKALEIVERVADRPFFLNLWYHSVHTPIEGKPELVAKYRDRVKPDAVHTNPDYAAMVQSLDENVGRVLAKLDQLGIADRTIVVFFSDNGGFVNTCKLHPGRAVTSNAPLRSGKGSVYEGGIRVPLVVRWPGVTSEGAESSEPVFSCDLYPTLIRAAGLTGDARHNQTVDGVDLRPLLDGSRAALDRKALHFHYPHYYPTTSPVSAVRSGNWKFIEYFEDDRTELYDLSSDVRETSNLVGERPDVAKRLQSELAAWRTSVEAQMPEANPQRR